MPTTEYMMIAPLADVDENGDTLIENGEPVRARIFEKQPRVRRRHSSHEIQTSRDHRAVPRLDVRLAGKLRSRKYGIKGQHWIEGPEKVINGVTYKTWEYPAAKYDEYTQNPPYSGMWELLPNLNVSNRVRSDLMDKEMAWYVACTSENEGARQRDGRGLAAQGFPLACHAGADRRWQICGRHPFLRMDGADEQRQIAVEILKDYVAEVSVSCKDYLDAVDANYQTAKQKLAEKFA